MDGYNVCGAWPKLQKHFRRGELEDARMKLLDACTPYGRANGGPLPSCPLAVPTFVAPFWHGCPSLVKQKEQLGGVAKAFWHMEGTNLCRKGTSSCHKEMY